MTEDNRDQYGRKDEKLKIYRIPLNFKIDASVLGFTIEWKRLFIGSRSNLFSNSINDRRHVFA